MCKWKSVAGKVFHFYAEYEIEIPLLTLSFSLNLNFFGQCGHWNGNMSMCVLIWRFEEFLINWILQIEHLNVGRCSVICNGIWYFKFFLAAKRLLHKKHSNVRLKFGKCILRWSRKSDSFLSSLPQKSQRNVLSRPQHLECSFKCFKSQKYALHFWQLQEIFDRKLIKILY